MCFCVVAGVFGATTTFMNAPNFVDVLFLAKRPFFSLIVHFCAKA